MKRKLFIAAGIFHPESGGPATYLYEILPHLQALDWEVRLQTYGDASSEDYPYPVTRIPRQFFPIRRLRYALTAAPLLSWADLVYAHTIDLPLIGNRSAPRVIKIVGDQAWERCIRRGWVAPDVNVDDFQLGDYGTKVRLQKDSRSRQVQAMDGVIVPSEYLKRIVKGWGVPSENIQVVYNALPPTNDTTQLTQAQARQQLNLPDEPILFTAARLTPWKGIDHTIAALKHIPDARLIVAGDGQDLPRLKQLAQPFGEQVTFLGNIPREQVHCYLKAADYFVLYSGYEGLSHTILESLRAETPVIASEKGGNPEVVKHEVNGLLVPYVNIEALIETIRSALQSDKREQLAANTHVDMRRFEFSTMVEATHQALLRYI